MLRANIGKNNEQTQDKILVKSDGTAVYTAKDIAYHLWKFGVLENKMKFSKWSDNINYILYRTDFDGVILDRKPANKIINVIDDRQAFTQKVVKDSLALLGFKQVADNYHHVSYGFLSLSPDTAKELGVDI